MATKVPLVIEQGAEFITQITLQDANNEPYDVTNMTARGQLRKHYTSTNSVSFTANLQTGLLTIKLSSNTTTNIVAGRYVYDVELVDSANNVTRLIEGVVTVTPEVTR